MDPIQIKMTDGKLYGVERSFGDKRVIINYDGLFVFADMAADGTWDLSGQPATTDDEKAAIAALTAPMDDVSIVTVTKD